MSLNGLEKLRMGYVPPRPPPNLPLVPDGVQPAITLDDAFDAWVMTPADDLRTLQEYASNPVPLVRRLPMPPPPPPSRPHILALDPDERIERKREDRRAAMLELPPDLPDLWEYGKIATGSITAATLQAGAIQDTDGTLRKMTDALEQDLKRAAGLHVCAFHDPDPEDRCPHGRDHRLCKQCRIGSDESRGPLGID